MGLPYNHIACCLDDSDAARRALAEARRLRAIGQGRLSLVHVAEFPLPYAAGFGGWSPDPADIAKAAGTWLADISADVEEGETVLLEGHPPAEVCDWAARQAVDLLVCASHRNLAHRIALGSFAHYLVNHAPCAVLVIRPVPKPAP